MKVIKIVAFIFFLFYFFSDSQAQKKSLTSKLLGYTKADADSIEIADYLFGQKDYDLALPYYERLSKTYPKDVSLIYRMGVCYLYKGDSKEKAIHCFTEVMDKDRKAADVSYYLGKAYFFNHQFDEATEYFNKYLSLKKPTEKNKKEIKRLLENCEYGKKLIKNPVAVEINNIGAPVNTQASEYSPVISSDESVLIYTYRGPRSTGGKQNVYNQPDPYGIYFEDIFISNRAHGKWLESESIGENINGVSHDACIALSSDGQKLFVYKNVGKDMGDIYLSRLEGSEWSFPEKLKGDINSPDSWEGSISISADEKTVYFASERKSGIGGKDIYRASLKEDGSWGNVINLGANINTPYHDDAPFIHPDGTQLYFASQGHDGMGGYDIYRVDAQTDGTWSAPVNLGYPINTADDELFYVLTSDGQRGYYSSGKVGGYGKQDIYVVEPGIVGKKTLLVLLKGQVTRNDQPVESEIIVTNFENGKNQGNYKSNGATGKYLINLPAGAKYKITYKVAGFEDQVQVIEAKNLEEFGEKNIDIRFFKKVDLYLVNASGKILQTAKQRGYGNFIFESLPDDEHCFFKLVPEDDTILVKNLQVFVSGDDTPKTLFRTGKDKFFTIEKLAVETIAMDMLNEENTKLKAPKTNLLFKKADLFLVDANGKVIQRAKQTEDGSFLFEHLPPDEQCFFKLIPEDDTTLFNKLRVFVAGNNTPKILFKIKGDKFFKFDKLAVETTVMSLSGEETTALKIAEMYQNYLNQYGTIHSIDLKFWVQIAAFKLSNKTVTFDHLKGLGKIDSKVSDDGYTKYTIGGSFKTLKEADDFKKKVIIKGSKDAFVYATYKDKKIPLKEVASNNFYQKK